MQLFDEDESENDEPKLNLNTNTEYAKKYNDWRKKEELHKLKAKYGDDPLLEDSGSSSSSSDDDEDGVFTNDKFNKGFYKVMAALKSKDPKIYQKDIKFFEEDEENCDETVKKKKKDKDKELPFDAYTGEVLKKQSNENDGFNKGKKLKSNIDEDIKKLMEVDSDSDDDPFSSSKSKNIVNKNAMEENLVDEKSVLEKLFKKKATTKEEQFLYDYIIAEGPKDNIVYDEDDGHTKTVIDHSDDDIEDAKQEEYEHKYNFRFEEPDPEFIKRYPRTIENSMRLKDDKRAQKRAEVKERKVKEKEQKMEEIRQLQKLKLNEIEEKISKLKQVTGKTDLELNQEDIDGDFDPEEHDRKMQALFNDEFYQGQEEEYKPEFPELDEELEIENWNKYSGELQDDTEETENNEELHCEDDNFNMDCDFDPSSTKKEIIESTRGKKKRKRKSKFAQVLSGKRPVFDPNNKTYEKYLDEYYKLDCEDIIGDIPCRFKYRSTIPNSFGLSIEEILAANDKELNKWCSIKKTMALRPDNVEKYDVIAYERKGSNLDLKKKILPSLFEENEGKGNKKKNKGQNSNNLEETKAETITKENKKETITKEENKKETITKKENKKETITKEKNKVVTVTKEKTKVDNVNDSNENIDEIQPNLSKKKNKKRKKLVQENTQANNAEKDTKNEDMKQEVELKNNNEVKQKKKKKKSKQPQNSNEELENNVSKTDLDTTIDNSVNESVNKSKKNKVKVEENVNKKGKKRKQNFDGNKNNKKANKQFKKNAKEENSMGLSDERLKAYGINPKKFKNKLKYKK